MAGRFAKRTLGWVAPLVAAATLLVAIPAPAAASIQVGASACPYADSPLGSLGRWGLNRAGRCMINEQRTKRGLRALASNRRLFRAARSHNSDMVWNLGVLTHSSSSGESAVHRIVRFGYTRGYSSWSVGEILAYGWGTFMTPRSIIRGWLNSPEHRRLMLKRGWRHFGVAGRHGIPGNPFAWGAVYTVDFGRRG
jgi:uncharacterized protein YkwD